MQKRRFQFALLCSLVILLGCEYKDIPNASAGFVDCSKSTLDVKLDSKQDATACNLIDGQIVVSATGGIAPYVFSLNGNAPQAGFTFNNLAPGIYIIEVIDANKCSRMVTVDLFSTGSDLDAIVVVSDDTDCLTGNGSFNVTPSGGKPPYTYQFGTSAFTDKATFDASVADLKTGFYSAAIKDDNGCPKAISVYVARGNSGVSFATTIKPIVDTNCAISGCHNGDNGPSRNWTDFSLFQKNAQNVKTRTGNRSMPLIGSLTDEQIQLIACWVDDGALNN